MLFTEPLTFTPVALEGLFFIVFVSIKLLVVIAQAAEAFTLSPESDKVNKTPSSAEKSRTRKRRRLKDNFTFVCLS
ncbi:MAG: hypothetical protein IKV21_00725, partial [Clostridia bacterium]|nr:hypothetical protein [Clostridia bacterium]